MLARRSLLDRIRDAEQLDIPKLIEKVETSFTWWRIAGMLLIVGGMVSTTLGRGDVRAFGASLTIGGVILIGLLKINAQTTISAIWIVSEIRKQRSQEVQPANSGD